MKLPLFKKLSIEQFRKQTEWVSHLIYPINSFFYNVTNTINGGLSFKDNLNAEIKEFTLSPPTSYPLIFTTTVTGKPEGLRVISVEEQAGSPANFSSAVFIDWVYVGEKKIKIRAIPGIDITKTYKLKLIVIGE